LTVPNHISMVTGLTPETHGVTEATAPPGFTVQGSIFELARQAGITTGLYLSKDKLEVLATPGTYDRLIVRNTLSSSTVVEQFTTELPEIERLVLVHIVDPDIAGHLHGWMSSEYLDAVRVSDGLIADIREALEDHELWSTATVIVTSDHGGI